MDDLPGLTVLALLGMARAAGLSLDALCEGLSFDAHSLKRFQRVPWDEYCILNERMEALAGGPTALADICARHYQSALPRDSRTVFAAFVEPKALFHFIIKVLEPFCFPTLIADYELVGADQIRISLRTRPHVRPCRSFFAGSVGAHHGMTAQFGLPMAEPSVEELTDRSVVMVLRLPPSATLLAKARRISRRAMEAAAANLLHFFSAEGAGRAEAPAGVNEDLRIRLQQAQGTWALTTRQLEVLTLVMGGRSNKEIAAVLDCAENTVEFHVTQLFKKAGVRGRGELIGRVWSGRSARSA